MIFFLPFTVETMLIQILQKALECEVGLELSVSNVETFKRRFYSTRKENPAFSILSCKVSPIDPKHKVWIIKNGKKENKPIP